MITDIDTLVTRIKEKISEKQKRRGRPRVMAEMRALHELTDVGTEYRSERQRINRAYAHDAIGRLGRGRDPAYFWLVNYVEEDRRPHSAFPKREQWTILAELGRIANDEAMRAVARDICARKPTTKDAVATIRRVRLGRQPPGGVDDLTDRLISFVCGYADSHAGVDLAMILEALDQAAQVVEAHWE
jgi:hypothetical protein